MSFPSCNLSKTTEIYSGYAFKSHDLQSEGIPVLKIANIQNKIVLKECRDNFPPELWTSKLEKYLLKSTDTLIAMTGAGSVGKVGKMMSMDRKYLVNQRVAIVRPDPGICDPEFIYQVLSQNYFEEKLYALGMGAGQPNVSAKDIGSLEIPFPPLETQRKIASILSAYDDLIENNTRRIKILEGMAQAIYREWFVNFRFPGHEKGKMVDSPLGKIPVGWEVAKLGDLIEIRKGKNITKSTVVSGSVPVVAGGISPAYYHNTANTRHPVITISASGANAGYVCLYHENVWASDCSVIDLATTPHVYFFYLQLKDRQTEVTRLQRGAAQPHVYPRDLMDLEAVKVPISILDRFTEYAAPAIHMIRNLTLKNTNLRKTRDLLLSKLISGEIDVSGMEIELREAVA